jgi:hypothetical protein
MRGIRPICLAFLVVSCGQDSDELSNDELSETEQAVTSNLTIDHVDAGSYNFFGAHDATIKSYRVGNFGGEIRDYFVFDVPSAAAFASSAQIVANNGGCGQVGGSGFDILRLYDVTTPAAQVMAPQTNRADIYGDLGAGTELATMSISGAAITAPTVTITLNAAGLAAIKKAAGSQMVIGGKFFDITAGTLFNHTECDPTPTAVQLLLAVDNQAPLAKCKDVTTCATAGHCDAPASIDNGSTDPDGDTLTITQTPLGAYPLGGQVVQLTVTDSKGASASCTGTVTVRDCENPDVSCPSPVSAECTGGKQAFLTPPAATATDTCSSTTTSTPLAQAFPLGTTSVGYTATDSAGNTATCSTTVTVHDTKAPAIQCPGAQSVECTGNGSAPATVGTAQAADLCTDVSITVNAPATFPLGTTAVAFTATDEAGNSASCTEAVTVVDTTPPAVNCPAAKSAECTGNHAATIDLGAATATDTCSTAQVSSVPAASYPIGTTQVAYTATDGDGLTATCTTTATVVDTTAPAIHCPAAVTAECSGNQQASVDPGQASASDVCGGVAVANPAAGSYPVGTTLTSFSATDDAGLTASCTSSVTVVDTTPPAISCPGAVTVECTGNGGAAANPGHATASDTCGGVTINDAPGGNFALGTTATVFSAVDAAGHSVSCTSSVTVVDTTPPAIQCPAPVVVECQANNQAVVDLPGAGAADSCSGAAGTDPAAAAYNLGTTPVLYGATDGAGNTASCATSVTVVDTQGPQLSNVPAPIQVQSQGANTPVSVPLPTATDGCQGAVAVASDAPATFPVGTTTVTFTAVDESGNAAHATTTVTVSDTAPPVFSNVPAPVSIQKNNPNGATYNLPMPTATDASDGVVPVTSDAPSIYPIGTTTVTFTATDSHGNTATATTTVTVTKKKPPTINHLDATPKLIYQHDHQMQTVQVSVSATDDTDPHPSCKIDSIESSQPQDSCGQHHDIDYKITGSLTAKVRRERSHHEDRVYTISVKCTDMDGDSASATTTVKVTKH